MMGLHTPIYDPDLDEWSTHGKLAERLGLDRSTIDHRVRMIACGHMKPDDLTAPKRQTSAEKKRGERYTRPSIRKRQQGPRILNGWVVI